MALGNIFDEMLVEYLKESDLESLLNSGKSEHALDLIRDIAKEVKDSDEFKMAKNEWIIKKEE